MKNHAAIEIVISGTIRGLQPLPVTFIFIPIRGTDCSKSA